MDKKSIIDQFKEPGAKLLASKVIDQVSLCKREQEIQYSEFFDPNQVVIAQKVLWLLGGCRYSFIGGYQEAERKILAVYPEWDEIEWHDGSIALIKIRSTNKFAITLTHRDYLGALMNLGIKRECLGDIVVHKDFAFIFILRHMIEYISFSLEKVKRDSITIETCPMEEFTLPDNLFKEINGNVSSIRLDSIFAAGFGISRTTAAKVISSGNVKLNWVECSSPSQLVEKDSLISAKGYGRIIFKEVYGETRKGRLQIKILKYI